MKKYLCTYLSGGGTVYDGGIWELKETPKTFTFTLLEKPFYSLNWDKLVYHKEKPGRHALHQYEEDEFVIYPDRCGTPYSFVSLD